MVEKFKFDTRLQEAVLKKRSGQQSTIIIDGEEREVKCPIFVGTGTRDIPCLVKKVKETENEGYSVVAISFDDRNEEEKYWICIRPALIEKAVGFSDFSWKTIKWAKWQRIAAM